MRTLKVNTNTAAKKYILLSILFFLYLFFSVRKSYNSETDLDLEDIKLVRRIRDYFLIAPPPAERKYNGEGLIESEGNTEQVMKLFSNKSDGFFIECGANDGIFLSSTLPLEVSLNWTGILIEPDPIPFQKLKENRRNAWIIQACLSLTGNAGNITMLRNKENQGMSFIEQEGVASPTNDIFQWETFPATCFPLYFILLAVGRTEIDYLALDVERAELAVLQTIPWDRVFIKTLTVEVYPEFVDSVRKYLEYVGYTYIKFIKTGCCTHDQLYVHSTVLDSLNVKSVVDS